MIRSMNLKSIPKELRQLNQWVCWKNSRSRKDEKTRKIPIDPLTGKYASTSNPATWGTIKDALQYHRKYSSTGIGFVFTTHDPFVGIDLDKCRNAKSGKIEKWAKDIVDLLDSYTEISPSGTGLHIIVRGKLSKGRNRSGSIEMYDHGRYFTVTGDVLNNQLIINKRTNRLQDLYETHINKAKSSKSKPLSDQHYIEQLKDRYSEDFEDLWEGDHSRYPSQSEADLRLCGMIATVSPGDKNRIDRIFRQSGLMRDKWDQKRGEKTYGEITIEKAVSSNPKTDNPQGLPLILMNNVPFRTILQEAWSALLQANSPEPVVFLRDGSIVRMANRSEGLTIEPATPTIMFDILSKIANWIRRNDATIIQVKPDKDVARVMIDSPKSKLPPLESIITTPVFSRDGSLIYTPGYHMDYGLYYSTKNAILIDSISDKPSELEVQNASDFLCDELLGDFPFETPSDKTHAVAAFLLPFVRHMILGCTPLHSVEAPTPGSGKSLLCDLTSIITTGHPSHARALPKDEDEIRKRITSELISSPQIIQFDNIKQNSTIDSPTLSAALTTEYWKDRILGVSQIISLKNTALWLLTGNNPRYSMELARRCVRIRLDAKQDRPWQRTHFRHKNIRRWALENRPQLVRSILLIIQSWIAQGRPSGIITLGSFEHWSEVIGGILDTAGIDGFLENQNDLYQYADAESEMWRDFTHKWWSKFREKPVSVKDLQVFCVRYECLNEILGDGNDRSQTSRLGRALKANRNRIYDDLQIQPCSDNKHRGRSYKLVLLEENNSDDSPHLRRHIRDVHKQRFS